MKRLTILTLIAAGFFSAASIAQEGRARVSAAASPTPVQPTAVPDLTPRPNVQPLAPATVPSGRGPMPTPLPGGVMPAPIDLKAEALEKSAPLTPQEILSLRRELEARSAAMTQPLAQVGKPVRRVVSLDLSPGAAPEVVRIAFGQGGVVTFLDAAGRPWPVLDVENFNPAGLDAAILGANGVSIAAKLPSTRIGNLAVRLDGMSSPVTIAVAAGQQEIDYSVEMQVARYLPGATAPVGAVESIPSLASGVLLDYLLGTPPSSARVLAADNPVVKAWQTDARTMVVRTEALLASPRYTRRQSSANGVTVYELPVSPRIILASQGQMQSVAVSGFEGTKEQK